MIHSGLSGQAEGWFVDKGSKFVILAPLKWITGQGIESVSFDTAIIWQNSTTECFNKKFRNNLENF
jgi:hypothetical protein